MTTIETGTKAAGLGEALPETTLAALKARATAAGHKAAAALVIVEHGRPVTTTEAVACAAGVQHKNVLARVREHLMDFQEFGQVAFQTRLNHQGSPTEYAVLSEPQSALLFTFLKNTPTVRAVKVRLVKEFFRVTAELQRLKAMHTAPEWQAARLETKRDFRNVADMLQEIRAEAGKDTGQHVYINESKLIRFAMTGSESAKWDRDSLPRDDLALLGKVERLDMRLIARDVPFRDRKAACRAMVMRERGLLLAGGSA